MASGTDYTNMTLDELRSEEKRLTAQKTLTALVIGLFIGIAVWSATHQGGFLLTAGLLIFAGMIGTRHAKSLKNIQAEISRRDAVR